MKVILIVQCRLSSSRLPRKALYDLDGKPLLSWSLQSMKKVLADDFFVACDYDSKDELFPLAQDNGFKIFSGSKDDVLNRFCRLIEEENPDIIVRATADNPFLFYEAANELLQLYKDKYFGKVDYITFTGLPHGSGIEIFNAKSLLVSEKQTDLSYDHEHVGPALYNHPDKFNSLFLESPKKFNYPNLRTTIDTYGDYIRCLDVIDFLNKKNCQAPYSSEQILEALQDKSIANKILFIPSTKKGQGTGHFSRCVSLAKKTKGLLYIDLDEKSIDYNKIIDSFDKKRIINNLPLKNEYDLIVCDKFKMTKEEANKYSSLGKTLFIDEGSSFDYTPDYLLDIIPSKKINRQHNLFNPSYMEFPKNNKSEFPLDKEIKEVLICFGGEDSGNYSWRFAKSCLELGLYVTVISKNTDLIKKRIPVWFEPRIKLIEYIENLKETLFNYDLVITHYGLTAFECVYARTPVLLACPTKLHKILAKKYGFYFIEQAQIDSDSIKNACLNVEKLRSLCFDLHLPSTFLFDEFILNMASAKKYKCPLCNSESNLKHKIVSRTIHHTFRKCSKCKMTYISFSDDSEKIEYEKSYFDTEYKNQYGKTYLEDFEFIKSNCVSRVKNINSIFKNKIKDKNILDIGCAYGPFLSCAKDFGWNSFGSDISVDAINYVKNELGFKAVIASFADIDIKKEFKIEKLDAVTMWYVIEHIKDLKSTLCSVNKMLKKGGVFSFSTPNAYGLTRLLNKNKFFNQSPKDHYSLWELPLSKKYLKPFGFKVVKIVSTGIHPERISFVAKHNLDKNKFIFNLIKCLIKILKIGDTYEVYCKKINGPKV